MKTKTLFPLAVFFLFSVASNAQSLTPPVKNHGTFATRVEVPIETVLTPYVGWDDNDHIQVVAFGHLPNSCYTLADATVEKVGTNQFTVRQFAHKTSEGLCEQEGQNLLSHMRVRIPFTNEIAIGTLPVGTYQVADRFFTVTPASAPMIDSEVYANVTQEQTADVLSGVSELKVTLKGVFNTSCIQLEKVDITKESDVYVLKPTIGIKQGVACADVLVPFETTVDLGLQAPGTYLVHSRSQNGRAVNHIVQVMK